MESRIIISTAIICSLLSLSVYKVNAQDNSAKLQWSDFKGKADLRIGYNAVIYWDVNYNCDVKYRGDTAIVDIKANCFIKENSWVRPNKESDQLLNHEQGHFTIGQILALDFQNEAKKNTYLKNNYEFKIDSIFWKLKYKYMDIEYEYDLETQHMYDTIAQKRWDKLLEEKKNAFKMKDKN